MDTVLEGVWLGGLVIATVVWGWGVVDWGMHRGVHWGVDGGVDGDASGVGSGGQGSDESNLGEHFVLLLVVVVSRLRLEN